MKRLLLLTLLLAGCAPKEEITYRIPADKQAEAAKLTLELTCSYSGQGWSPIYVSEVVSKQVLFLYGVPVSREQEREQGFVGTPTPVGPEKP